MKLSKCVYPKMQDAENNIERNSPEATVLKLINSRHSAFNSSTLE